MSPKILRRCSICGKFHAAYLVEEQGQKRYYCYNCWSAHQAAQAKIGAVENTSPLETPPAANTKELPEK